MLGGVIPPGSGAVPIYAGRRRRLRRAPPTKGLARRPDHICVYSAPQGHGAVPSNWPSPDNIFADVVNRKTIPTAADLIARFEYHAERLMVAAITQTYNYIEGGLEYGILTTGEAIILLRVDWQDPETLLYHLAEPSFEMADHIDFMISRMKLNYGLQDLWPKLPPDSAPVAAISYRQPCVPAPDQAPQAIAAPRT
ncbi:hypothetical protein JX266_013929 [Neoarthrinium moseri]|nr:hypothetical protein JX266_013929 [Neoarthrinium moseri]